MLNKAIQEFKSRPGVQKAAKGVAYLGSEKLFKMIVGIFIHAWLARYLQPENFGKISYVLNIAAIFFFFSLLGLDDVVIRDLVRNKEKKESIISDVFFVRLLGSLFGIFIYIIFVNITTQDESIRELQLWYSLVIFVQIFATFELPFLSEMKNETIFWGRTCGYSTGTVLKVVGLLKTFLLPFFVMTYAVEEFISKFFIFFRYLKSSSFKPTFKLNDYQLRIVKESFPLFLVSFIALFEQKLGFYFLEKLNDQKELGFYSVSVTLIDIWNFLPVAITMTLFSKLVTSKERDQSLYDSRVQYLIDLCVWLAIGMIVGVFLTADLIIRILYGDKYLGAEDVLRWVSLPSIFVFFNYARIKYLVLEKSLKSLTVISSISFMTSAIGLYLQGENLSSQKVVLTMMGAFIISNIIGSIVDSNIRKTNIMLIKSIGFPLRVFNRFSK